MISHLKSFLLIAFVTALIWLLAESESLRVEKVPGVRIQFRADPDSNRMVRVDPNQDFNGTATIRLEGSAAQVDAIATVLRKEVRLTPGSEGVPGETVSHASVSLQTAIAALPLIRNSGVTIAEVDPPTAFITVDTVVPQDFPVRAEFPPSLILDGPPEITPATIQLRSPASIPLPRDLQLVARVDAAALANLPEGRRAVLNNIPVEIPDLLRNADPTFVRLTPREVSIALTPRSRSAAILVPTIPIHIRLAPTELSIWDIQLPPESRVLTDVPVSGPAELIDQIRTERLKPVAFVSVSFEDLERAAAAGETIEKEVLFSDLPSTLKFEPKQRTVRLTVKRRESPTSAVEPTPDP